MHILIHRTNMRSSKTPVQDDDLILHPVEHFRQRWDWDCGISCVMMLLSPEQREYFLQNFKQICEEQGIKESTWRIDLCYLLKRFGIEHTMYTSYAGVNEDYRRHKYYSRVIDDDRARVQARFSGAAAAGVRVETRVLGAAALLRPRAPPRAAAGGRARARLRPLPAQQAAGRVQVVPGRVPGALRGGGGLLYRDPARAPRLCAAPAARLARAAAAPGTDHDCILLHPTPASDHPV